MPFLVDGTLIRTPENTRYLDRRENPIAFFDFFLNGEVKIEGVFLKDGSLLAIIIRKEGKDIGIIEIEGRTAEIDSVGQVFVIN